MRVRNAWVKEEKLNFFVFSLHTSTVLEGSGTIECILVVNCTKMYAINSVPTIGKNCY